MAASPPSICLTRRILEVSRILLLQLVGHIMPKRETLVRLLRESFERYTTAAPNELRKAGGRNTRWLLRSGFARKANQNPELLSTGVSL
jgi:hypothetical protein